MKEYGGNILKKLGEQLEHGYCFANDAYKYMFIHLREGEEYSIHEYASATLYCLSTEQYNSVEVDQLNDRLWAGDAIQIENSTVTIRVPDGGAELLLAGTLKRVSKEEGLTIKRSHELKKVVKPWGHELWLNGEHPGYALKQIYLKAGQRTSLQYHNFKRETNVLFSGEARLHFKSNAGVENDNVDPKDLASVVIQPVSVVDVYPSTLHRLEACTDIILYEVSTPHLDDVVRVADDTTRKNGKIAAEHSPATQPENPCVVILAAGRGTRLGNDYNFINKALLPLDKKAILSWIIDSFPRESDFVIAVGHLADQVRQYLSIAHPNRKIRLVKVDNYDGPGSGPGHSLLCCKPFLQKPFHFTTCDTLWDREIDYYAQEDWLGTFPVASEITDKYCNFKIENDRVVGIFDKQRVQGPEYQVFIGLCKIFHYQDFWEALESKKLVAGEHQISNGIQALVEKFKPRAVQIDFVDTGTRDGYIEAVKRYENFDFAKTNESLYIINDKVIKFFADPRVSEQRVAKSRLNRDVFPEITHARGGFYAYDFLRGETLYQHCTPQLFRELLDWLDSSLWRSVEVPQAEMRQLCEKFYHQKTVERVQAYLRKYPDGDQIETVNSLPVPALSDLLEACPWDEICEGVPCFFHGDLQFDNIIYDDQSNQFTLLDWRQDFAGHIGFGDLYYDLAKLYGGLNLNYDYIKQNLLSYSEKNGRAEVDFAQRYRSPDYLNCLSEFIRAKRLSVERVRLITALIYLNMAPLHKAPFDRMLFALGKMLLTKEVAGVAKQRNTNLHFSSEGAR